jgi:hypothetical protein
MGIEIVGLTFCPPPPLCPLTPTSDSTADTHQSRLAKMMTSVSATTFVENLRRSKLR